MKKILVWAIVILALVWVIFTFTNKPKQNNIAPLADESSSNTAQTVPLLENTEGANAAAVKASILYTGTGFSPALITIKKGTEVMFSNESGKDFWPASALHPTHTVYPGSSIAKCKTVEASKIFDACVGVKSGSTWSFVFNETGSWKYHDHLESSHFGTVVVTE